MSNEFDDLISSIRSFAIARDWEQFHTPKNLAMAITGEAGELASEFHLQPNTSPVTGSPMSGVPKSMRSALLGTPANCV